MKFGDVESIGPVQVLSSSQLTATAPPSFTTGRASFNVSVRGISALSNPQVTYIAAFGPFFSFSNATCGSASVSAQVFNHDGNTVSGEAVTLNATKGSFVTTSSTSQIFTGQTDNSGQVVTKMVTGDSIAVSGHTHTRPTPDEFGSVQVLMTASFCEFLKHFYELNLPVLVAVGEHLVPSVVDGCQACSDPSRFRVQWQTKTPILNGLSVVAFTDDATVARDLTISVLDASKALAILKRTPTINQPVTLINVQGAMDNARVRLSYSGEQQQNERVALYLLKADEWVPVPSLDVKGQGLTANVSIAGTYAIVIR